MMFGSVVIPAKAIVLNLLSLTATFGAMVWIFQDGHLSGLLDFTATGSLDAAMPILMFCVAFGLSMDYEVFLLSRIKEEHDNGADNVTLGGRRPGADRPDRHRRRRAHRGRVICLRHRPGQLHQAVRRRPDPGGAHRRLPDPGHAGAGVHAARRATGTGGRPAPLRRFHDRWGVSEHVDLDDEDGADAPTHTRRAMLTEVSTHRAVRTHDRR